jgi:phospholipid/cholesterol/gamma-HCH transport system substrate-binding protein
METRASYLLVGSFVLILFAGTVGFVIWLGKFQFDQIYTRYDIRVAGSVSGLKVGSGVELNGIPVGEVIDIRIDPANVEHVLVAIEVPSDTPVKIDTSASLQITGITGGLKVQLSGGTQEAPMLEPGPGQERAVIAARASSLDEFLEGAPELLENLQLLVQRTSNLLNPRNQQAFSDTLQNVSVLTGSLAARSGDIELLIADAATTMANMRDASLAMKDLAGTLTKATDQLVDRAGDALVSVAGTSDTLRTAINKTAPDVNSLIRELRGSAFAFTEMSEELEALIAENRAPLRDFTGEGLYELTNFLAEARNLIDGLSRVTTEVQRDPARFLFGNQQQGYEAEGSNAR